MGNVPGGTFPANVLYKRTLALIQMSSRNPSSQESAPIGGWFTTRKEKDTAFLTWIKGEWTLQDLLTEAQLHNWLSPRQCADEEIMNALVEKKGITLGLLNPTKYCKNMVRKKAAAAAARLKKSQSGRPPLITLQCNMNVLCDKAVRQNPLCQLIANEFYAKHFHTDTVACAFSQTRSPQEPQWPRTLNETEWRELKTILEWKKNTWPKQGDHTLLESLILFH